LISEVHFEQVPNGKKSGEQYGQTVWDIIQELLHIQSTVA